MSSPSLDCFRVVFYVGDYIYKDATKRESIADAVLRRAYREKNGQGLNVFLENENNLY
jgi:hypothetical protein